MRMNPEEVSRLADRIPAPATLEMRLIAAMAIDIAELRKRVEQIERERRDEIDDGR